MFEVLGGTPTLIVPCPIMANKLNTLRQSLNEFFIEHPNGRSRVIMSVDTYHTIVLGFTVFQELFSG